MRAKGTVPFHHSGSTRLKADTAQELVLNMISIGCMVRLGKAYQNLKVDLQPMNEKFVARARTLIHRTGALQGCSRNFFRLCCVITTFVSMSAEPSSRQSGMR